LQCYICWHWDLFRYEYQGSAAGYKKGKTQYFRIIQPSHIPATSLVFTFTVTAGIEIKDFAQISNL
jgi:hypothetical protein